MELVNEITNYLSTNQPVTLGIAAILAIALQYGINRVKYVGKLTNYVLGLVALPGATTLLSSLALGVPTKYAPVTAVVGQLLYATYETLKKNIAQNALGNAPTVAAPTQGPATEVQQF